MNKQYGLMLLAGIMIIMGICYIKTSDKNNHKEIALLVPAIHPSMKAIEEGLVKTIRDIMPDAQVIIYNANGNKALLKGQAEKIARHNYIACCAIGTNASTMMATTYAKHNKDVLLIALAVATEVAERLTEVYRYSSGIVDYIDKNKQIDLLLQLKSVKNPLLVYDPASNPIFDMQSRQYHNIFKAYGIELSLLPVHSVQEVYQKVSAVISNYDVIMTFTDHTLCSAMDALLKLCNQHGVLLYTSDLDSNAKGAALSYGVQERHYGEMAARIVSQFCKQRVLPSFKKNHPFYLKINKDAAVLQGLEVPKVYHPEDVSVLYTEGNSHG